MDLQDFRAWLAWNRFTDSKDVWSNGPVRVIIDKHGVINVHAYDTPEPGPYSLWSLEFYGTPLPFVARVVEQALDEATARLLPNG